ncbi:hypothetical protein K1T71_013076 [Dendrolimus kikuchii]|uniref:Uncharacterized protein n=1 Tax=Dendrolimus kikuchii TaxID=765133 RepID=A0ACC1CIX7_9NEOP|nr:hypothetical protein K1T71_013076 [Dendrolimus kikuchii]
MNNCCRILLLLFLCFLIFFSLHIKIRRRKDHEEQVPAAAKSASFVTCLVRPYPVSPFLLFYPRSRQRHQLVRINFLCEISYSSVRAIFVKRSTKFLLHVLMYTYLTGQLSVSDSNIPQSSKPQEDMTDIRTSVPKRQRAAGKQSSEFSELKQMINTLMSTQNKRLDLLEEHIKEVKAGTTAMNSTGQEIELGLNNMSEQLKNLESKIDSLELDKKAIAKNIISLEEKIDTIERLSLKTSIEIRNVPKSFQENKEILYNMLQNLMLTLNVNYNKSEIRDVQRTHNSKENKVSSLIVEFHNTLQLSSLMNSVKKYNKENAERLNSTHLGISGTGNLNGPIYISECLTSKSKRLFYVTREFAKKYNYAFCWTSGGKIYLRKETGSQYILIKNEARLEELKNVNPTK